MGISLMLLKLVTFGILFVIIKSLIKGFQVGQTLKYHQRNSAQTSANSDKSGHNTIDAEYEVLRED